MSKKHNYYEKISNLVSQGRLDIKLMISPPRTSSTLIETSLQSSPDVEYGVHEPFIHVNQDGAYTDLGYRNIYESIGGKTFETSGQSGTVVIKELSHRLNISDEHQRLFSLAKEPVLFLIRNPLLTVESRIRKIIQTLPLKARLPTQQWMLDYYARDMGYQDWQSLSVNRGTDIFMGDRDLDDLFREPDLEIQGKLLDYYSNKLDFTNWEELRDSVLNNQDYRQLGDVLQIDPERFILDTVGEGSLEEQMRYLEENGKDIVIIDSTDFRLGPEFTMRTLCGAWSIAYDDEMISWGNRDLDLKRGGQEFQDLVWYDTLVSSEGVVPPFEIPPTLASFPNFVQEHLLRGDLPQYSRLSNHIRRIKVEDRLREQEFEIAVSPENKSRLTKLGVISSEMNNSATMNISDIDPIYALLNYPELNSDQEYLKRKSEYAEAINILKREGGIQSIEGDFPGRRK